MSTYLCDEDTVFTTMCLSNNDEQKTHSYRDRLATQLQSIIKFTNHECYVITDTPEYFGNYYGPRIHFVKFDENITTMNRYGKQGQFNYNLKMIPIKYTLEHTNAAVVVWMDCDTFLFGWTRLFARQFPPESEGVWGRFRHALNDSASHNLILEKLKIMNIDATNISTKLPVENVLFFKRGPTIQKFIDSWYKFAMLSYDVGARSDFESVEMCLALTESGLPYHHMDNATSYNVDDFRTFHHGPGLHIPFVI